MQPGLVVHAGANLCQERFEYDKAGYGPIIWIEALASVSNQAESLLGEFENQVILQAALWDSSGVEIPFHIASNNAESSSVFKFKWHKALHPHISTESTLILKSQVLDDVIGKYFEQIVPVISLLVLDLQGAEYQALIGSKNILENTQAIHIEVSSVELYKGQKLIYQIDEMLNGLGFKLVEHYLTNKNSSGDALYIRQTLVGELECMPLPNRPIFPSVTIKNFFKFLLIRIGVPAKLIQSLIDVIRGRS